MKKTLLLAIGFLPFLVSAQTTIIADDFESYNPGDLLAATSPLWITWSGSSGEDAPVSDKQASSGSNSLYIIGNFGPADIVLPFPSDYTSGTYELSMKIYVVSGKGAYYNLQQSSTPGLGWMFEAYFDNAGGGEIWAGGPSAATFNYTPDTWTDTRIVVDLSADLAEFFINGNSIHSWQWSLGFDGSGAEKMWGGVDIYAYAFAAQDAEFFVDDVVFSALDACLVPTGLSVSNITATTVNLKWDPVADAIGYKISYHPAGSPIGVKKPSNDNSKLIKDLAPETKYKWAVQSICSNNPVVSSPYTLGPTFTTAPLRLGQEVNASSDMEIFPNPASENTTISFSLDDASAVEITLFDINGRVAREIENAAYPSGNHQVVFHMEGVPAGAYMVQLTTNEEVVTKKLMIER